jgi:hypothetical protein
MKMEVYIRGLFVMESFMDMDSSSGQMDHNIEEITLMANGKVMVNFSTAKTQVFQKVYGNKAC